MKLFDLVFLVSFFAVLATLSRLCYLLVRGRRQGARNTAIALLAFVGLYAMVLVSVSLASPQKVLAVGELQCFDDWCITVEAVSRQQRIGATSANGVYLVVTTHVSSRARGRRQRETDVYVYVTDYRGGRFDVSLPGQDALRRAGLAGEPLTTYVDPGEAFESRLAFDVPTEATDLGFVKRSHGWFPGLLIIGDPQSFLHRPTTVHLAP